MRGFTGLRLLRQGAILLAVMVLTAGSMVPAAARDLSGLERSALARTVSRFDDAMRRKSIPTIIDIVPPRIVAHIAAQHGIDPGTLRRSMIEQTRAALNPSVLRAFRMDLARARYGATPSGAPYALIPTATTVRSGGRDIESRSNTLAMMDGGRWYLLDLNQPSRVAIFTQVYPEFRGVPLGGQGI
ncbi:hypothetical protein [Enterovirga rhinocerotis]|uniref:Uncharacterized protein n=1 Tax=Enterovirga rhinocerotis TaxID=1339210 RepID=A0A4V3DX28_9HYPH|nr:hypothetical protein [Enterovirga rhinocerotis]TDR87089.1 hypothetical protein EV668_4168 [Enterovirga rhinocerotis]